jgi:hypothetical protein
VYGLAPLYYEVHSFTSKPRHDKFLHHYGMDEYFRSRDGHREFHLLKFEGSKLAGEVKDDRALELMSFAIDVSMDVRCLSCPRDYH